MQNLQTFIDLLTKGRNFHISILDINGITNTPLTKIAFRSVIHSNNFCNIAKSTKKGYRTCLFCKKLANTRAIKGKKPFAGHCAYGLYEVGFPVIVNDSVAAIIYVGNIIVDKQKTTSLIEKTCHSTGVNRENLQAETNYCEYLDDYNEAFAIAEIVRDYLLMLSENATASFNEMHWMVYQLQRHIKHSYCNPFSLSDFATEYQKNEKYLGRLFKKEMGMSVHEYCNQLRLKKAVALLDTTSKKIIDIALECGFNNIAYFNRVFRAKYGISPTEYRNKN